MKMSIKKLRRAGNKFNILLKINLILIGIYLIDAIIIFPIMSEGVLRLLGEKPDFLIAIKCFYALVMGISIVSFNKKSYLLWLILNLTSIAVLFIWVYSFQFNTSTVDAFMLELSSVWILILTNLKSFVQTYGMKIKKSIIKFSARKKSIKKQYQIDKIMKNRKILGGVILLLSAVFIVIYLLSGIKEFFFPPLILGYGFKSPTFYFLKLFYAIVFL